MTLNKNFLRLRFYILEVLRRNRLHPVRKGFGFAGAAGKTTHEAPILAASSLSTLQYRGLTYLVTSSTKIMRGLALAHFFLQCIYHAPRKRGRQFVALLLSFPVFYAFQFFFRISFLLNQRRILLLYGSDEGLKANYCILEIYQLGVALCRVGRGNQVCRKLRDARSELDKSS